MWRMKNYNHMEMMKLIICIKIIFKYNKHHKINHMVVVLEVKQPNLINK